MVEALLKILFILIINFRLVLTTHRRLMHKDQQEPFTFNYANGSHMQAIEDYESFINHSRQDFLRLISREQSPSFEEMIKSTDDINLRLEYYSHIHQFRKQLKESLTRQSFSPARTFDFSLCIKSGS
jgi:hypothetical protein